MKTCSHCQILKSKEDFYKDKSKKDGLQSNCKSCVKEISKIRYNDNKSYLLSKQKEYQSKNRDHILAYKKAYYEKNKESLLNKKKKYRQDNKEQILKKRIEFYSKNRDKILERRRVLQKKRKDNDPFFKAICSIRTRLYLFCKDVKLNKNFKTMDSIGLTSMEFKTYIESLFLDGMDWSNYGKGIGKWSIDHIKPLRTAQSIDEVFALNHYKNLQPMWSQDNSAKGGKYDE